jgi:hypothetical protein
MPKQNFTINTRNDMVGNLYGISYTNSVRHSFLNAADDMETVVGIPFGCAVQASDEDRWAVLGHDGTGNLKGIAIRQHAHEAKDRPSTTGAVEIPAGASMAVLLEGFMTVEVDVIPVIGIDRVWVDNDTGEFATSDGGNHTQLRNAKWHYANVADGIWDRADVLTAVVEVSSSPIYLPAP